MKSKSGAHSNTTPMPEEQDPVPNWKPFYFGPFYCGLLIVLHVLYIVAVQLLTKHHHHDENQISVVQSNSSSLDTPDSIFLFSETNVRAYIVWQYVPVLLAVCIGLLWEVLDVNIRRLEPFHQLSTEAGGHVDNALCLDYTNTFSSFTVHFTHSDDDILL
jgi:hypothetical protein